jgi:hypothetical protein
MSSYLAFRFAQGIPHSCGTCPRSNQEKGILQGLRGIQHGLRGTTCVIKQVKAQLAELDDSAGGEAGTSRHSNKKSNVVTTAEGSPADPALQVNILSEIKQAQEATDKGQGQG